MTLYCYFCTRDIKDDDISHFIDIEYNGHFLLLRTCTDRECKNSLVEYLATSLESWGLGKNDKA